jgi:hypothetical protein
MDHLRILKRAFEVTWKYRALWLVGLLLVLAGGGVISGFRPGSPGSPGDNSGGQGGEPSWGGPNGGLELQQFREKVVPILVAIAVVVVVVVVAIFVLVFLLSILALIVRYVTRVSLMQMVQSHEETGEEIGFGRGLRLGWSRSAWRLFAINLIFRVPLALLMIVLIVPIVGLAIGGFVTGRGPGIVLGIILVLLTIPIILVGAVVRIALKPVLEVIGRACVIRGVDVGTAIREGWGLIRRNLGATALQWLLLVGLGIAWSIALIPINLALVFLALFVSGIPALALGGISALFFSWPVGLIIGGIAFVPTFILLVGLPNLALNTLATVYQSTVWTLTYRELLAIDEADMGVLAESADLEPVEEEPDTEEGPHDQ